MKTKSTLLLLLLALTISGFSQTKKQAVQINLKDGKSYDAVHFGQFRCGTKTFGENYIIVRGKFMDNVTEIKKYGDIEKIIPEGYTKDPVASIGNEKGVLTIIKKNGVSVTLEEAELAMSCYGTGDLYNTLIVQILNPLTNKIAEQTIETKNIQSIIFK